MKLIHLSDLHIGKRVNEVSMIEDQEYILTQILRIIDEEKVDAVLIAGDVYDKSVPSAEAVTLFDDFLCRLAKRQMPTLIISGNHDSPERLAFGNRLFESSGIHISPVYNGEVEFVAMSDEHGEVTFWLLPFVKPAHVKRYYSDAGIESYTDAIRTAIAHMDFDKASRNVLLTHQFVTGASTCESEEISVGGSDNVDASVFADFDYVALGHIHGPQNIGCSRIRYCGTPLKYSFSEARHKKSVTIVEMLEKGETKVRTVPLYPLHDVRLIEGKLADIMAMPYSEDYVWITIHDELPPPDAKVTLTVNFPNMMKFSVVNSRTKYDLDVKATDAMESKSVAELFCDFYRLQNNDQLPGEAHMQVLGKVIKELEEAPYEAR